MPKGFGEKVRLKAPDVRLQIADEKFKFPVCGKHALSVFQDNDGRMTYKHSWLSKIPGTKKKVTRTIYHKS